MAKAKRGRPSLTGENGERFQVHLPPKAAKKLKKAGGGSLSQGIIRASYVIPEQKLDPKQRYAVVTDPAEIEAIKRADLKDPIGGKLEGIWFAEIHSLMQFREQEVDIDV